MYIMKNKNKSKDTHYICYQTIGEHYTVSIEKSHNSNVIFNTYDNPKNDSHFTIAYGIKDTKEGEMFMVNICM